MLSLVEIELKLQIRVEKNESNDAHGFINIIQVILLQIYYYTFFILSRNSSNQIRLSLHSLLFQNVYKRIRNFITCELKDKNVCL